MAQSERSISGAQLVSGIIGTVDIASILTEFVQLQLDLDLAANEYKRLKTMSEYYRTLLPDRWRRWAEASPESLIAEAGSQAESTFMGCMADLWNSLVNAAGGKKISSALEGQISKLYAQQWGLGLWTDLIISIPQTKIRDKVERYYNRVLTPYIPNTQNALNMYFRGLIDYQTLINIIMENEGVSSDYANKTIMANYRVPDPKTAFQMLMEGTIDYKTYSGMIKANGYPDNYADIFYKVFDSEPDIFMAFSMYKRGLINKDQLKDLLKINGYDPTWHDTLISALHKIPTFYDLMRICDYVELPHTFIEEMLRKNGFDESTASFLAKAIEKRPFREEVRAITTTLVYSYYTGLIDYGDLTSAFDSLGLLPQEKSLNLAYAQHRRSQYKMLLSMDIIEQKTRKGLYTTIEEIKNALVGIGMDLEIANLIAEKWYYQYIYGG